MVFGKTIVLPGEFFEPSSQTPTDPSEFLLRLRETFRTLKPTPTSCHSSTSCFVYTALKTCSHVFVRNRKPPIPLIDIAPTTSNSLSTSAASSSSTVSMFTPLPASCPVLQTTTTTSNTIPSTSQEAKLTSKLRKKTVHLKTHTKHKILTFNSPKLPTTIKAGYLNCTIRPYVPNPLRCFKCQKFGHSQTSCRGQLTCSRCASVGHASTDYALEQKCVNCQQPHPSDS
ncbi:gag-Pol polyprotein [Trichonephila clavipes]|nr:gag-Pol polyprotein [Trichonephila clavipes]